MKRSIGILLTATVLAVPLMACADAARPAKRTTAPAAQPSPRPTATPTPVATAPAPSATSAAGRWLATHNTERKRIGIAPLTWSDKLATDAAGWARYLAANKKFEHAGNIPEGENLWMGTAGYFTPEQMIGTFVDERRYFRPGKFPDISTTGKWSDVGHYTQLIWPATRQVGCALATGNGYDVLVCRYYPAGNVIGQMVP